MLNRQAIKPSTFDSNRNREFFLLALALILILGVGAGVTWQSIRTKDARMREEMLIQVRMLAQAIDWERLQKLTGLEADVASSDYLRIKNQLSMIRSAHPRCRFIYLMGQRQDGTIFFFVDSESPNSKDYSPPGQIYKEVPDSYRQVFTTRRAAVVGPVSDRWGTWISALVPLTVPGTEKLIAVVGMDIDAQHWEKDIFIHSFTPIVTTLLFATLFTFFFNLQQRTVREKQRIADSEEELRQSEQRYRDVYISAPLAFVLWDQECRVTDWNDRAEKVFGWTRAEIIGKNFLEFLIPESARPQVQAVIALLQKGELPSLSINENLTKDGRIILCEWNNVIRYDAEGNWSGATSLALDITERKRAEAALRENEERFRSVITVSNTGAWEYHLKSDYLWCSPEYFTMLGRNPGEFIMDGRSNLKETWLDLLHPEDRERARQHFAEYLENGSVGMYENFFRMRHTDGSWVWLWSRGQTLRNSDGSLSDLTVGTHINITEQKMAEEEKEKLQEQLRQAQKMEAIGTLAGGIAHDFNNILGAIIGYTEIAQGIVPGNKELQDSLNHVLQSAARATNLVKQILAFSRKSGQEHNPIQLHLIIQEAQKMLRASLPATIEFRQNIVKQNDTVKADPTQIHQIVMNLCTNAAHAMQDQGGVLEISLEPLELNEDSTGSYVDLQPGSYIRLTVRDTGTGIAPEIKDRIFDPFFTTKEVGKGTGMGLAVVHGIVKSHGGIMTVESKLGKGSSFHIVLPRIEQVLSAPIAVDKQTPKGTERILLVDDEQTLLDVATTLLEHLGYKVTSQKSCLEALELFQKDPLAFDLVITDQTMPGMTGDIFAQNIMRIRPDMPIILCTGYSEKVSEEKAKELGIRAFVMKPINLRNIAETIRNVLDGKQVQHLI